MRYPVWIHCCKWPNYDFCISQGSVATVLRWGGQNYSHLCQVSSWCCMPKLSKSANVWRSHSKNKSGFLFLEHGVHADICYRVRTDSKILFFGTFQDLQKPNSRVFQDSQNSFTRTFEDKFGSQKWLHKVQKVHVSNQLSVYLHYSNSVSEIQIDPKGNKLHTTFYNEFLL